MIAETEQALERFRATLAARDGSAHTVDGYVSDVRRFASWFHERHPSASLVTETAMADIRAYRDHMVDVLRRKPATVNRHLLSLRRFFTVLGGGRDNPAAGVRSVRAPKRMKPLGLTLGKLVRTRFLLRFFGQPDLRRTTRRALNLTESRHKLSRDLCLGNRGRLRGYNLRDVTSRASALTLLSNCVVAWNTLRLNRIVADLRESGTDVSEEVLAGVSPFKTAHVQLHGTYRFQVAPATLSRGAWLHIEIAHSLL